MKIYRVEYQPEVGVSAGFEYFASKRAAQRAAAAWCREQDGEPDTEITVLHFTPTKTGVLNLLTRIAAHPDNG